MPKFHLISLHSLQEATHASFPLQNTGKARIQFTLRSRSQFGMPILLILDRSEILPGKDEILVQSCWVS